MASERIRKLLAFMEDNGIELFVALHGGVHSFLEPNPVYLLSGAKAIGESMVLLWRGGGELVVTPGWDAERIARRTDLKVTAANHLLPVLQKKLAGARLVPERIGFAGLGEFGREFHGAVAAMLGHPPRELDRELYRVAGSVKSPEEIERARKAAWIAERAYERMLECARPGMTEYELAAEVDRQVKKLGADANFQLMSASQHNRAIRVPGPRVLEKGDVVLAEISPSYEGQFAQICRTVVLGEVGETFLEKYELQVRAMRKGMEAAVPGARMSDVFRAVNRLLEEHGYGEFCRPPWIRVRGHGLGVGSVLPGNVSEDNDTVLEKGMVFVLHPNQYFPETGYLMCGEPVVIGDGGAEPLTRRKPAVDFIPC